MCIMYSDLYIIHIYRAGRVISFNMSIPGVYGTPYGPYISSNDP